MSCVRHVVTAGVVLCLLVLALACAMTRAASAQAWGFAPAGVGAVTIQSQWISNTGHRFTNGTLNPFGPSLNRAIYIETEYAFTDRFSIDVGVPYVFSKWTSATPPPPIFTFHPWDQCHCWQSGWQDFGFTARYNIFGKAFGLTPSVTFGMPSHDYEFRGEAVLGRNLKETQLAVDVGQRLDAISGRLSVQGRYSYTFVERVLDIPNNRSNFSIEPGFQLTRNLFVREFQTWQRTHGGLRLGSPNSELLPPGDLNTPVLRDQADRFRRVNYFHLGAGASYRLPRVDVFGSYVAYVSGSDTHAGRAFTIGVSYPFELRRGKKGP